MRRWRRSKRINAAAGPVFLPMGFLELRDTQSQNGSDFGLRSGDPRHGWPHRVGRKFLRRCALLRLRLAEKQAGPRPFNRQINLMRRRHRSCCSLGHDQEAFQIEHGGTGPVGGLLHGVDRAFARAQPWLRPIRMRERIIMAESRDRISPWRPGASRLRGKFEQVRPRPWQCVRRAFLCGWRRLPLHASRRYRGCVRRRRRQFPQL